METRHSTSMVTLLTDFGLDDEYVGVMKGVLLRGCPALQIIDLCHAIGPHNIHQAAAMLEVSYPYFAAGTIHVVVIDPGVGSERHILVVEADNQIFIGPDNGVLTPLLQSHNLKNCYRLDLPDLAKDNTSNTFHGRDIIAPAAAKIACGEKLDMQGKKISAADCVLLAPITATLSGEEITGEVTAIDHFGNLNTSITAKQVETLGQEVRIVVGSTTITNVSAAYGEVPHGDPVALINSRDKLEIAINGGNAASTLGAAFGQKIIVKKKATTG